VNSKKENSLLQGLEDLVGILGEENFLYWRRPNPYLQGYEKTLQVLVIASRWVLELRTLLQGLKDLVGIVGGWGSVFWLGGRIQTYKVKKNLAGFWFVQVGEF
jgi:hypothetical protein